MSKSVTHTVAFSLVIVVPCAVIITDESIDFLIVSCFSGVNSFRLIMCSDVCESTMHSLALRSSSVSKKHGVQVLV